MNIDASTSLTLLLSGSTAPIPEGDGSSTRDPAVTPLADAPVADTGKQRGPKKGDKSNRSEAAVVALSRNAERIAEKFAARENSPIDVPPGLARWLPETADAVTGDGGSTPPAPQVPGDAPVDGPIAADDRADEPAGEPVVPSAPAPIDNDAPITADLSSLRIDLFA